MCGIYASEIGSVNVMLAAMAHRGPDRFASIDFKKFSVGAVRLAIVDTRAPEAQQPYTTRRGNIVCLNGEIYNYRKLWRDAPSEVALVGEMIDDGLDPRKFFDGDYAILHFNPSTHKLTLYRDRFGVVPLYYMTKPWVAVSSEARTVFYPKEVPAHGRVQMDLRKRRAKVDVLPLYGATGQHVSFKGLCSEIEEAVWTRATHTDVPFSLALSGGLDSSVIAYALRNRDLKPDQALVTAYTEESEDLKCARIVADQLRFPLSASVVAKELTVEEIERIFTHFDCLPEKITDLRWQGAVRSWFVAKYSQSRVILCGDGADELLGGYATHYFAHAGGREYRGIARRLTTLRSMQHFNLDRTNKMGMAHSREFRAPFLASTLSQILLSSAFDHPKMLLRRVLNYWGAPEEIAMRTYKYSPDELAARKP